MDDAMGRPGGSEEKPAVFFRDAGAFRRWLERHHADESELWIETRKAHVADRGLTWADAVPEALCFGWIDSVSQPIDEDRRRQRWTPRKRGSTWSKVNVAHAERLIVDGRMAPAGIATAKRPATRIARAQQLVEDSAAGRLVPFARPGRPPAWRAGRLRQHPQHPQHPSRAEPPRGRG